MMYVPLPAYPEKEPLGKCSVDPDSPYAHTLDDNKWTEHYEPIRDASSYMAMLIRQHCPQREETRQAFLKMEEALMWVTAALTRKPESEPK